MRLTHQMFRQHGGQVRVCFDHLSTDVGSRVWQEQIKEPGSFQTLLRLKEAVDAGSLHPFPVDNLCLFVPGHLEPGFVLRIEALLTVLDHLERYCRELFHLLFACQSGQWIWQLSGLLDPYLATAGIRTAFFAKPPLEAIIDQLGAALQADAALPPVPFLADLIRFTRKKLAPHGCPPLPAPAAILATDRLLLDPGRYSIHQQDYAGLELLVQRLDQASGGPLAYERTVCFFFPDGILSMPHRDFRITLARFAEARTLAEYELYLAAKGLDPARHRPLVEQLYLAGVLQKIQ